MESRKYIIKNDYFIYAITDEDNMAAHQHKTAIYLGKKGGGRLIYITGLDELADEADLADCLRRDEALFINFVDSYEEA